MFIHCEFSESNVFVTCSSLHQVIQYLLIQHVQDVCKVCSCCMLNFIKIFYNTHDQIVFDGHKVSLLQLRQNPCVQGRQSRIRIVICCVVEIYSQCPLEVNVSFSALHFIRKGGCLSPVCEHKLFLCFSLVRLDLVILQLQKSIHIVENWHFFE